MHAFGFFRNALPRLTRWLQGAAVASSVESGGKPADVNSVGVSAVLGELARPDEEKEEG
jgi:hypothetical protein